MDMVWYICNIAIYCVYGNDIYIWRAGQTIRPWG